ncbi:MAG: NADH-quinone oxidoreductase subunit NuoN [Gammaproteobacteria bacterium]|nr:MAG: NADH-quinone oxidoreductase subunit NuoN [Gammaproteobacteria bacterium]
MIFEVVNMSFALPEMFMLTMACVILLVVAFLGKNGASTAYGLSQLTLAITAILIYQGMEASGGLTFDGTYIKDAFSDVLKLTICLINIAVLLYSTSYLKARALFKGEYYVLAVFATLGMMVMVSAYHFLTLYLGLELMSLCMYAMVAMHRDSSVATEAAMKYFILGAIASGMLLYGMSIIYGVTGSLSIATIAEVIQTGGVDNTVLSFGLVFLIIGIGFKLGAVPFHMWLPDVYHGAPTAVTLFIATAPKIAAFAMAIRLLVDGLGDVHQHWQGMLIMLSVLSMIIGNVVAIAQTNLKRMLAYSTISHVGFILLGILSGSQEGYAAAMFYALVYSLMSLGGFGMIILLSRQGFEADTIDDYKGLSERNPWYALMMLILMFSMAGIPPLVGFYAKLTVIKAVVDINLISVAIVAVLMSVIGAFYYLRIIKVMYFDQPVEQHKLEAPADMRVMISANALAVFALGVFPGSLMAICVAVFA